MPGRFGVRLRHLRKLRGYTMEELGELVGVAKTTISGYENGNREPPLSVMYKLAGTLQSSADYLLGLTDIWEQPLLQASEEVVLDRNGVHWDGLELNEDELQSIRELMATLMLNRSKRNNA